MQGNSVSVTRLLGLSIILASIALALGLRWGQTGVDSRSGVAAPILAVSQAKAQDREDKEIPPRAMTKEEARALVEPFLKWWAEATGKYAENPEKRMKELLNQPDESREIELEWERFWMLDQPSHMTYDRVDGGIG